MSDNNCQGHQADPATGLHVSVGQPSTGTARVFELLREYTEARDYRAIADDNTSTGQVARADAWVDESFAALSAAIEQLAAREPVRLPDEDVSKIYAAWFPARGTSFADLIRDAETAVLKANGLVE